MRVKTFVLVRDDGNWLHMSQDRKTIEEMYQRHPELHLEEWTYPADVGDGSSGPPYKIRLQLSQHELARRRKPVWRVTRDGNPVFGPATHNECWLYLHTTSSGASVDWRLKHEGYAIVAL